MRLIFTEAVGRSVRFIDCTLLTHMSRPTQLLSQSGFPTDPDTVQTVLVKAHLFQHRTPTVLG